MNLAPIILFVYNRPWHTEKTLEALMRNDLAEQSILYIYCDGAKTHSAPEDFKKIEDVRTLVKSKSWCKEIHVIERDENLGLANSVIIGVTEVIEKHGRVIVLEDDIITGTSFLKFLNDGLNIYENEQRVFGVSGHNFSTNKKVKEDTYFLPIMSSWAYGTWLNRWQQIEFDGHKLLNVIENKQLGAQLDFGSIAYNQMLKDQVVGKNDSWAVRFQVSMFLKKGVFLYPNKKLIENIGFDGSGVHCKKTIKQPDEDKMISNNEVKVFKIPVLLNNKIVHNFRNANKSNKTLKSKVIKLLPPEIKALIKRKLNKNESKQTDVFNILKAVPRYTKTSAVINGNELQIPDSASFLFMYDEIFKTEIYKFNTENQSPYIIDGGANIGLASIYFKQLFPDAEIVAFEPDPEIFNILQSNIKSHGLQSVELVKKGLWNEDTILNFKMEGADAGLLETVHKSGTSKMQTVSVISLKPYLQRPVDFLKLDIEGAETVVLKDIAEDLTNVERIFIEYHSFVGQLQSLNEIIDILTNARFRLYMSIPGNNSLKSPFMGLENYNKMDFQLNIFGFKQDCNK